MTAREGYGGAPGQPMARIRTLPASRVATLPARRTPPARLAGALLCWALAPVAAAAQEAPYVPLVLHLPGSVRAVGMNGAEGALVGDAGSLFANPTGLATIRHIGLEGLARRAPGSGYYLSGGVGWRLAQLDVGVGGKLFDLGDGPSRYLPGSPAANVQEVLGQGTLVYRYGLIAMGVSAKYVRRKVDGVYQRGATGDLGLAIAVFDIMAFAFSVQNVGGNWRDGSPIMLPRLTRLGFTMNYTDPQETYRLLTTVEFEWPEGRSLRVVQGAEAGIVVEGVGLVARAGYATRDDPLAAAHLTFGASVHVGAAKVDYAYRHRDLLDEAAHYLGLRLTL